MQNGKEGTNRPLATPPPQGCKHSTRNPGPTNPPPRPKTTGPRAEGRHLGGARGTFSGKNARADKLLPEAAAGERPDARDYVLRINVGLSTNNVGLRNSLLIVPLWMQWGQVTGCDGRRNAK